MPAETIDKNLIIQFSDMIHVTAQQMKARLRPYVEIRKMTGDVYAYDGLTQVEAREIVGRIQQVQFDDIEHLRRKIARRRFAITLPIDDIDVRAMLLNPESQYAAAVVRGMERRFDRVLVEAAFADVKTGRDFETTVTYANDGGTTINATAGVTYEKLLESIKTFINNEVGIESQEKMLLCLTGTEHDALMKETELVSGDFTRQFAIEKGRLVTAAGFDLIPFGASVNNPILDASQSSGTVRNCIAMSSRALCAAVSKEFEIKIEPRADYYDLKQVQIIGVLGAVRTEGKLIHKFQTTV